MPSAITGGDSLDSKRGRAAEAVGASLVEPFTPTDDISDALYTAEGRSDYKTDRRQNLEIPIVSPEF